MSQPARIPTPAHGLESKAITTKLPKRPVGVSPDRGLFAFAAALFLAEAVAIAIMYTVSLCDGFSLVIVTNQFGEFWIAFVPVLASVPLAIYILWVVERRFVARLVARWQLDPPASDPSSDGSANPDPTAPWLGDGLLAVAAVLFFAEAATLAISFAASYFTGFSTALTTDSYGEFWLEFPIVLAAVPFALYVLGTASERLLPSLHRMRQVDSITS